MKDLLRNRELITRAPSTAMLGQMDHLEKEKENGKGRQFFHSEGHCYHIEFYL